MPPVQALLVAAAVGALWFGGRAAVHGVKKASHAVCHVVTLGEKCKPPKVDPPKQK